jgi:hypothetical protein
MTTTASPRETALQGALIRISTESWRLLQAVKRIQAGLDADQQRRMASRISFYDRVLEDGLSEVGLRLVDFTGQEYGPQLAATAINADDFETSEELVVESTIEPAVVGPEGLLKSGTVTLRRVVR